MRLRQLLINNFRQFYGERELHFPDGIDGRNITVIHGYNGSGKTALLNAFIWCLYGETNLPRIYQEELGELFPGARLKEHHIFGQQEMGILLEACDGDELHFQLLRELLDVEGRYRTSARRAGLYDKLEEALKRNAYSDMEDATARARLQRELLEYSERGDREGVERIFEALRATPLEGLPEDMTFRQQTEGAFPV